MQLIDGAFYIQNNYIFKYSYLNGRKCYSKI